MKFLTISSRAMAMIALFVLGSIFSGYGQSVAKPIEQNCYSVLVGRGASVDGSVLLAHNEDDFGDQLFNWIIVPRLTHSKHDKFETLQGALIAQADTTYRYLWLDMPGMAFSDSYMNENGVTIVSNSCPSREDAPVLTSGGITWELRQLMAQRAKSARHAVKIASRLISELGYAASGRTYSIADANEAWMLSVVNGKHFVALRIPDNHVAVIPNYYTITEVNLSDTTNCIASPDLITYAQNRGWYNPSQGKFNFREAYGNPDALNHPENIMRMWMGVNSLQTRQFSPNESFPWSFKPSDLVSVEKLSLLLANHYENTPFDHTNGYLNGNPHENDPSTICATHNQYGFIAQLRNWMPTDVGCLWWIAPRRPCLHPFTPLYAGINSFPERFSMYNYQDAIKHHFDEIESMRAIAPNHIYYDFFDLTAYGDSISYINALRKRVVEKDNLFRNYIKRQEKFELETLALWVRDRDAARKRLTEYSIEGIEKSAASSLESLKSLKK